MSRFGQGPTGGGGVRPRQDDPPRGGGGAPRTGGSYGGGGGSEGTVADHWPGYLEGGYFDERGNLKIEFVSAVIPGEEQLPDDRRNGVEPLVRGMANANPPLTTGQIRRFFQHCRGLETQLRNGMSWARLRPQFEFLAAAAADAYGKQPRKISRLFYSFIRRNVDAVKSEKDFLEGFLPHFEALVGFGSLYVQKDRN